MAVVLERTCHESGPQRKAGIRISAAAKKTMLPASARPAPPNTRGESQWHQGLG